MQHPFGAGIDELGTHPDRVKFEAMGMIAEDALGNPAAISNLCSIIWSKLNMVDGPRKLPILYLLDYISKRFGEPFQFAFSGQLVPSFVSAYHMAPPMDKEKLKGLLKTWNDQQLYAQYLPQIYAQILADAGPYGGGYDGGMHAAKRPRMDGGQAMPMPMQQGYQQHMQGGYPAQYGMQGYNQGMMQQYPGQMQQMQQAPTQQQPGGMGMGMMMDPYAQQQQAGMSMGLPPMQPAYPAQYQQPMHMQQQGAGMMMMGGGMGGMGGAQGGFDPYQQQQVQQPMAGAFQPVPRPPMAPMPMQPMGIPMQVPPMPMPMPMPMPGVPALPARPPPPLPQGPAFARGLAVSVAGGAVPGAAPGPAAGGGALARIVAGMRAAGGSSSKAGSEGTSSTMDAAADMHNPATEISAASLSVRDETALIRLYRGFPFQCKSCGVRFALAAELPPHVAGHSKEMETGKARSRWWHLKEDSWLSCKARDAEVEPLVPMDPDRAGGAHAKQAGQGEEEEGLGGLDRLDSSAVGAGKERVFADEFPDAKCASCGDAFSKRFDDESERWVYAGAVTVQVPPGSGIRKVYHSGCKPDN